MTQASWDDVWLSEGFATWFSAKVMDQEQPPARRLLASIAARERIMATDAGPKTRPVRLEMHTRKDTDSVYSQFVYQKGAAILLMLDGWMGEEKVRAGLHNYLEAHKFGNASTADLESALAGSKPVLDTFLNRTGIPTVHVKCNDSKLEVDASPNWNIPVCWRGEGLSSTCTVVATHAEVPLKSCPTWIYPNAGGTGYYRSEWTGDPDIVKLTAAERLTLVYDLRAAKNITSPILKSLTTDAEPEIAKAATDVMAGK